MSWRDRDYARAPHSPGPTHYAPTRGRLIGGSIVTTLIVINVAIFVLEAMFPALQRLISGGQGRTGLGTVLIVSGWFELRADLVMKGQIWRLISAQYLHAGTGHLLINMLVLHFLGRPLERMWSVRRFFTIYTMCGLAGNVFYTILGSKGVIESWMPAVGASGSIYGLLGIVAVLFPQATVYVYFLFPIKIRTAALIFGGIAAFSVIVRAEGSNYGGEACHLAGLVFGVWWAMKGDAWWASTRWRVPHRSPRTSRPKKKGFVQKVAQRRADEETIDSILKKVYDGGIHSLTDSEKRALQEATERQKQRDREAGRVDRL